MYIYTGALARIDSYTGWCVVCRRGPASCTHLKVEHLARTHPRGAAREFYYVGAAARVRIACTS
jgi:hypothetical protein